MRNSLVIPAAFVGVLAIAVADGRNPPPQDAALHIAQSKDKSAVGTKNCAEGKRWDTRSRTCV